MSRVICMASILAFAVPVVSQAGAAEEILIADFEGSDYGKWEVTGDAFGTAP